MEQPKLKVEFVETDSLVPYAKNARVHTKAQVETIVASIKQFGFNDPVGVWNNGDELEIVEGHGRVMAAKELGIKRIPIIRLDHLDDDGRRAYTIVHNQTTDNSVWDYAMLDSEIAELCEFDWAEFGVSDISSLDIDDLFVERSIEEAKQAEPQTCPNCGYEL